MEIKIVQHITKCIKTLISIGGGLYRKQRCLRQKQPAMHFIATQTRVRAGLEYYELLFHIYLLIMTRLLLNRKNEVSWICSDKLAASCHLHWFPSHTIPVHCDSQYMHHHIPPLTWCDCPPAGQ